MDDFKTLRGNIEENGCSNFIPINSAVLDKKERLHLKFKGREFEAEALSNIISNLDIAVNSVNYVKIDIVGGKRSIIPSSINIIRRID